MSQKVHYAWLCMMVFCERLLFFFFFVKLELLKNHPVSSSNISVYSSRFFKFSLLIINDGRFRKKPNEYNLRQTDQNQQGSIQRKPGLTNPNKIRGRHNLINELIKYQHKRDSNRNCFLRNCLSHQHVALLVPKHKKSEQEHEYVSRLLIIDENEPCLGCNF